MTVRFTYRVLKTIDLQVDIALFKILFKLKDKRYTVLNVSDNSLTFYNNPWKLMWNFQAMGRLDGGKFDIDISGKNITITFNYYVSILWPLVILAGLSIVLIANGQYTGILFFAVFYTIALGIQYLISKSVGIDLLNEIVGSVGPDL